MFRLSQRNEVRDFSEKGKEGVIDAVLEPTREWRIRVQGVYWRACSRVHTNFQPGDRIRVIGRNENKLLIVPG